MAQPRLVAVTLPPAHGAWTATGIRTPPAVALNLAEAWTSGGTAVFAAGSDATGAYTVYVSGIEDVADIHVDRGDGHI